MFVARSTKGVHTAHALSVYCFSDLGPLMRLFKKVHFLYVENSKKSKKVSLSEIAAGISWFSYYFLRCSSTLNLGARPRRMGDSFFSVDVCF